ncbi:serine hydrolase domain-containing protein [Sandarakinorhabdus sp.]|uniref:serine hydrolase domain-containing protein n=1 Tax=Sandarakinorhabdus sp. TaxID=1916663 RepID=UPI00333E2D8D
MIPAKHVIWAMILAGAAGAAAAPPPPLTNMWQAASAAARTGGLNGHLVVADSQSNYGEDIGKPGKTGQFWRWASVTKQIVAVLVMQQVDAGTVALDTPIKAYVPQLPVTNADRITLRQLLAHTSGLPNAQDGPMNAAGTELALLDRSTPRPAPTIDARGINAVCTGAAKAAPGERFEYNNCDTQVAGAVLEAVTGKTLRQLLRAQLFKPLKMDGARLLQAGDAAGRTGYFADGSNDDFIDVGRYGAAAAIAGPPAALVKFDQALLAGRLMSAAARTEMWNGKAELGFSALGQWAYTVPLAGCTGPVDLVERRGSIGGVEVRNVIAPKLGRILIAFADRPAEFGEPWQGKGLTYDLLSAAFCAPSKS